MADSAGERALLDEVVATALGRQERHDPVLAGSGGPAGNAVLTAWLGLVLLVLFFLEGLTLLDVRGLITWHVALGALLVPPVLAKTATTGWRILRYYSGQRAYRTAGPPPLALRVLGPLVVVTSVVLLGSGVMLILLGEQSSRSSVDLLGWRLDWVGLHKSVFWAWFVVMTVHVLARTVPALRLTIRRDGVPGIGYRLASVTLALALAAGTAVWLVGADGSWRHGRSDDDGDRGQIARDR